MISYNKRMKDLEELYIENYDSLVKFVESLGVDRFGADDVLQNGFMVAMRHIGTYNPNKPMFPWFRRVVQRESWKYHRGLDRALVGRKREVYLSQHGEGNEDRDSVLKNLPGGEGLDDFFDAEELEVERRTLNEVLPLLKREQRIVIELGLQGLSYREISDVFGVTRGAVKIKGTRGKQRLRELVGTA